MESIIIAIFGFYFSAIDAFAGRPDSLEAVIVFSIFAYFLTGFTVIVPLMILLGVVLYHVGPALLEILWYIERGIKAMRSVTPLWAWMVIAFVMYHLGMLFGEIAHPHHATLIGGIYAATFAGMMLTGIWVAKQDQKKTERYIPAFVVVIILAIVLSVPLYSWAVAPGIGIVVAFCGTLGMTIQSVIEVRRKRPYQSRS